MSQGQSSATRNEAAITSDDEQFLAEAREIVARGDQSPNAFDRDRLDYRRSALLLKLASTLPSAVAATMPYEGPERRNPCGDCNEHGGKCPHHGETCKVFKRARSPLPSSIAASIPDDVQKAINAGPYPRRQGGRAHAAFWIDAETPKAFAERIAKMMLKPQSATTAPMYQLIKDAQEMLIRQNGCYPLPYDAGKAPLRALLKRLDAALEGAPDSVLGVGAVADSASAQK